MPKKTAATGGSWRSPLTTKHIVSASVSLSEPRLANGMVYWLEGRPLEGGRQVIVRRHDNGDCSDVIPAPYSARNRVHEYGGGAYTAFRDRVYFCNDSDAGIYVADGKSRPRPLHVARSRRFADLVVHPSGRYLFCICEDHGKGEAEPENSLVMLDLDQPDHLTTVASGEDFYASPAVSPDGTSLAWISWSHPDMPWDRTVLWLAYVDHEQGTVSHARRLLDDGSSVFQPAWSPDNRLYCSTDRDQGWWNIHYWDGLDFDNLCPMDAEFALPQWQFGMSTSGFLSANQMLVGYSRHGSWNLGLLCTHTGELQKLKTAYSQFSAISAAGETAVLLASSPRELPGVFEYRGRSVTRLTPPSRLAVDDADIAIAEPIDFPVSDGSLVHGFFYPPTNRHYALPPGERPPLIVMSHGGPTAATGNSYNIKVQFWTTRGFAVLDVNYRGSTGYGRAYRQKLRDQWGIADVEDCATGARCLADAGRVDGERLIIRGSSAGGYTTLCALTFHDTFKAGASLYGIGDLEALARDTHKFEAHYLDRLVGPYPETIERYRQRSPIHHVENLDCPVIFLQGLQDKVVPPAQAESMVTALKQKGVMAEYVSFAREQHGFRKSETIRKAFRKELGFYGKVFGFTPIDD